MGSHQIKCAVCRDVIDDVWYRATHGRRGPALVLDAVENIVDDVCDAHFVDHREIAQGAGGTHTYKPRTVQNNATRNHWSNYAMRAACRLVIQNNQHRIATFVLSRTKRCCQGTRLAPPANISGLILNELQHEICNRRACHTKGHG